MEEKQAQRIFSMVSGGDFKIETEIPDEFTEEKVINALLAINRKGVFDKFDIFQKMVNAHCTPYTTKNEKFTELLEEVPSRDENMVQILTDAGFDIDGQEHVIAVYKKAIDHLMHLNRNKFKEKIKDIKKKSRRVLHKLGNGVDDQNGLDELIEEAKSYFDNFEQYWSKRRRRSSMSVTAEESLTEGVL